MKESEYLKEVNTQLNGRFLVPGDTHPRVRLEARPPDLAHLRQPWIGSASIRLGSQNAFT